MIYMLRSEDLGCCIRHDVIGLTNWNSQEHSIKHYHPQVYNAMDDTMSRIAVRSETSWEYGHRLNPMMLMNECTVLLPRSGHDVCFSWAFPSISVIHVNHKGTVVHIIFPWWRSALYEFCFLVYCSIIIKMKARWSSISRVWMPCGFPARLYLPFKCKLMKDCTDQSPTLYQLDLNTISFPVVAMTQ